MIGYMNITDIFCGPVNIFIGQGLRTTVFFFSGRPTEGHGQGHKVIYLGVISYGSIVKYEVSIMI